MISKAAPHKIELSTYVPQGELEGGEKVEYLEGEPANAEEDDHHEEHLCHLQLDRHSSDLVQLIQL